MRSRLTSRVKVGYITCHSIRRWKEDIISPSWNNVRLAMHTLGSDCIASGKSLNRLQTKRRLLLCVCIADITQASRIDYSFPKHLTYTEYMYRTMGWGTHDVKLFSQETHTPCRSPKSTSFVVPYCVVNFSYIREVLHYCPGACEVSVKYLCKWIHESTPHKCWDQHKITPTQICGMP